MRKVMGWVIKEKRQELPHFTIGVVDDFVSGVENEMFDGVLLFTHRRDAMRFLKEGQIIVKAEMYYER